MGYLTMNTFRAGQSSTPLVLYHQLQPMWDTLWSSRMGPCGRLPPCLGSLRTFRRRFDDERARGNTVCTSTNCTNRIHLLVMSLSSTPLNVCTPSPAQKIRSWTSCIPDLPFVNTSTPPSQNLCNMLNRCANNMPVSETEKGGKGDTLA